MLWGEGLGLVSNLGGWGVWRGVWGIDALGRGVGSGQQLRHATCMLHLRNTYKSCLVSPSYLH